MIVCYNSDILYRLDAHDVSKFSKHSLRGGYQASFNKKKQKEN